MNPQTPTMAPSDDVLLERIGAMFDTVDPAVLPDPVLLASRRRLLVGLCDMYGAGNVPPVADADLLLQFPPFPGRPRVIESCADLTALADDVSGGAL